MLLGYAKEENLSAIKGIQLADASSFKLLHTYEVKRMEEIYNLGMALEELVRLNKISFEKGNILLNVRLKLNNYFFGLAYVYNKCYQYFNHYHDFDEGENFIEKIKFLNAHMVRLFEFSLVLTLFVSICKNDNLHPKYKEKFNKISALIKFFVFHREICFMINQTMQYLEKLNQVKSDTTDITLRILFTRRKELSLLFKDFVEYVKKIDATAERKIKNLNEAANKKFIDAAIREEIMKKTNAELLQEDKLNKNAKRKLRRKKKRAKQELQNVVVPNKISLSKMIETPSGDQIIVNEQCINHKKQSDAPQLTLQQEIKIIVADFNSGNKHKFKNLNAARVKLNALRHESSKESLAYINTANAELLSLYARSQYSLGKKYNSFNESLALYRAAMMEYCGLVINSNNDSSVQVLYKYISFSLQLVENHIKNCEKEMNEMIEFFEKKINESLQKREHIYDNFLKNFSIKEEGEEAWNWRARNHLFNSKHANDRNDKRGQAGKLKRYVKDGKAILLAIEEINVKLNHERNGPP